MLFAGSYMVEVDDNGKFKIPENFEAAMDDGTTYKVFRTIHKRKDYTEDPWLLSFVFDKFYYYDDEKLIYEGTVTKDKKLKVPDEYLKIMKGERLLLGNLYSLELTIFPDEAFDLDEDELRALGIDDE